MKHIAWEVRLGLILILSSVFLYLFHYVIFLDTHHILIYMIGDLAFLPIEVLLVTLVIHRLLSSREKREVMEKMNMVIGAFYSEVGTRMLSYLSEFDPKLEEIRNELIMTQDWSDERFANVSTRLRKHEYRIEIQKVDLQYLRSYFVEKRDFLLRLLENPNLLENESFTELLRAVFHLTEELVKRDEMKKLPESDLKHLKGDIERAYRSVVYQWLDYMKYLKNNYPYLFSLAIRTNPFDHSASVIVK